MASGTAEQEDEGAQRAAPEFDALALAKTLLRSVGSGALATLDAQGAPFSSLTSVATDADGRPLLLLSRLAAHTGHLEADARASLLLARIGRGDPLAHPRLTLTGRVSRLERGQPVEHERARRRFLARASEGRALRRLCRFLPSGGSIRRKPISTAASRARRNCRARELLTEVGEGASARLGRGGRARPYERGSRRGDRALRDGASRRRARTLAAHRARSRGLRPRAGR